MRSIETIALSMLLSLAVGANAVADVRVSIQDGRVSIVATDATVAEILTEWARIGQTRIVNADRTSPERVTIELNDVSEQQALDVLLRGTSGYLAAARLVAVPSASLFDRIVVMPPSIAPTSQPAKRSVEADPPPFGIPAYEAETPEASEAAEQPDVVEAPATDSGATTTGAVSEEQRYWGTDSATEEPTASARKSFSPRQGLVVADPREFRFPPQPGKGGTPPADVADEPVRPAGSAVPGIVLPTPRAPGQPPTVHR
jgi:hypothetical protein